MKVVSLTQNTPEWLDWRAKKIGASDSPIILGVSPYKTPLQLYQEKKGECEVEISSFATSYGHGMEPTALMFYQRYTGIKMKPECVENDDYPNLAASLDGYSQLKNIHVEIKCPGKKDMELARKGELPGHYNVQMQHQMLVTGTSTAHYYAFDGTEGRLIVVHADKDVQNEILEKTQEFCNMIITSNPPPLSDRDTKNIASPVIRLTVSEYRRTKNLIRELNERKTELENEILALCDHPRCSAYGLRVTQSSRRGVISYKKLAEEKLDLEKIDLDSFRGEPKQVNYFKDTLDEQ